MIISYPLFIKIISYIVAIVLVVWIFVWYYKRYQSDYQKKIKEKYFIVKTLIVALLFFYLIKAFLFIPINVFLAYASRLNPIEYYDTQWSVISKRNMPLFNVSYEFNGNKYSTHIKLPTYDNEYLTDNYKLVLKVRKSLFGTYYIEEIYLHNK